MRLPPALLVQKLVQKLAQLIQGSELQNLFIYGRLYLLADLGLVQGKILGHYIQVSG
jgi:hypothetical protein